MEKQNDEYRIRKLTPRECLRLMGVDDSDIDKMEAVNSNNQLYKQAGNSIVVPVLEAIFTRMFLETEPLSRQLEIDDFLF
jgi:DNA (cytosine-5)-methyltransferase 1